ncbi:hypothetical protein CY652_15230 [Burkholderia sp. WAC0059]|uniref:hypothetical protein n=1 Tax=Burkholderia sp. WAC0059 TaxID=2066022 RepID=UPI000C7F7155|nr:hypothetical protein [Burkholderia sp. WAC0059]PLZ01469.1 hypothetical protein CY652_15230 [Burkholderia sp. WAC0059]
MIRIARRLLPASLALLALSTGARAVERPDSDLAQAQRLVVQSRQLIRDAHRRNPHEFGGHEAKAAALLRLASVQLDEAHDFRAFNASRARRHRPVAR